MLHKTELFSARQGGYHNYRIPSILATPAGVAFVTVEARRGHGGDWDESDLLIRRSSDGGQRWAPAHRLIASTAYGPGPVHNCVPIWDQGAGLVHVLFCHDYARVFAMSSADHGATFNTPVEITAVFTPFREQYAWRVVATGPGHGIQLRSGRLVAPIWLSTGAGTEFGAGRLGHRPSVVASIYSDDHGHTWQRGEIVAAHGQHFVNPGETVAAQLSDGRVLFNIRSESAEQRRLAAISPDGATAWSTPHFVEALLEPVCMASILGYDPMPGTLLFANPDNLENELTPPGRPNHDRKRLTVKLSRDDGQSWPVANVLEPGPSAYSDLALLPDGTILCAYEQGMGDRMTDPATVTVARFDLAWLGAPSDASAAAR